MITSIKKLRGFGITEMLVVMVIIGIMAAVAVPIYRDKIVRNRVENHLLPILTAYQNKASSNPAQPCMKDEMYEFYGNNSGLTENTNENRISKDPMIEGVRAFYDVGTNTRSIQIVATMMNSGNQGIGIAQIGTQPLIIEATSTNGTSWVCRSDPAYSDFIPYSCQMNNVSSLVTANTINSNTWNYNNLYYGGCVPDTPSTLAGSIPPNGLPTWMSVDSSTGDVPANTDGTGDLTGSTYQGGYGFGVSERVTSNPTIPQEMSYDPINNTSQFIVFDSDYGMTGMDVNISYMGYDYGYAPERGAYQLYDANDNPIGSAVEFGPTSSLNVNSSTPFYKIKFYAKPYGSSGSGPPYSLETYNQDTSDYFISGVSNVQGIDGS